MPDNMQGETKKKGILRSVVSLLIAVLAVFALAWLLRQFVFQSYEIPSASMEETIMTGDLVFSEKLSYRFGEPKQGDIVFFEDPEIPGRTLVKRVIATGGQTVNLVDGSVYVDGQKLDEPYTDGLPSYPLSSSMTGESITYPYKVGEGELWVMGDNRTNSQDSRYFGSIPVSTVDGKAAFVYWPLDHLGLI